MWDFAQVDGAICVRLSIERNLSDGPNVKSALRFLPASPQTSIPGAGIEVVLWLAARFGWKARSKRELTTHPRRARRRRALKVDAYDHRARQIGDSDILAAWLIAAIVLLFLSAFG